MCISSFEQVLRLERGLDLIVHGIYNTKTTGTNPPPLATMDWVAGGGWISPESSKTNPRMKTWLDSHDGKKQLACIREKPPNKGPNDRKKD